MAVVATFRGFSPALIDFFTDLAAHNQRAWFDAHRTDYEQVLMAPARQFVDAMSEYLPRLGDGLHAEPKVRGSILAINRDTRFSADKTPYKTYLDLWFWHGDGPSRERPGYFLRLAPAGLTLGAGMHRFSEDALASYRQAVLDPVQGERLEQAVAAVLANPTDKAPDIGGETYKRVPAGLPAEHPRARWLKHSGLVAATQQPITPAVFGEDLPGWCFARFSQLAPLQQWLVDVLPQ